MVESGGHVVPIEVKDRALPRPEVPRAFNGFVDKYRPPYCQIINKSLRTTVRLRGTEVRFVTVWDLLPPDAGK